MQPRESVLKLDDIQCGCEVIQFDLSFVFSRVRRYEWDPSIDLRISKQLSPRDKLHWNLNKSNKSTLDVVNTSYVYL